MSGSLYAWVKQGGIVSREFLIALATVLFLWGASPAVAKYSSIVIDADTGKVLSEVNADAQNYPASLTKMMTLYLTFDALEKGRIKLDQEFAVSPHAAGKAPSKLGLVPGDTISVRDLILAVVTHSANDAATVLAEGLAGSEPAFAERMNEKARQLGMMHTNYHNASGLPDPLQLTTARDLVRLALALYRDFPKEYHYFSTEEFTYKGATYGNHNHLMSAFEGMDGIKTGYIRASGFNLAASAVRDNHRLIGVVMGGESAHSRDMKMAALLNAAFAGRPAAETAVADDDAGDGAAPAPSLTRRAARTIAALSPVGKAEAATPPAPPTRSAHKHAGERWGIQVGAYNQHAAAEKAAASALGKLHGAKGKAVQVLGPLKTDKERVYRARIVNFTEQEAAKACHVLRKKQKACAVVAASPLRVASR